MILIFFGLVSGISSFVVSFNLTTEVLRYRQNQQTISELNYTNQVNLLKINSRQKVRFNEKVNCIIIPSFRDLSSENINELWYTDHEFNRFKIEIIKSRMNKN
jgi:hypothetical protein